MSRPSRPAGRSYTLWTSPSAGSAPSNASPSGKSFALPPTSTPSTKPEGRSVFSALARAQAEEESRKRFQQATAPKPAYRDAAGSEHKIDPAEPTVQTLRKAVTPEKYASRPARSQAYYGPSPATPPTVFHDPFGPMFYVWMLERASAERRAAWAYHHRRRMDESRWADMVRRDPQLPSRLQQLEAAGQPRDPAYVPPELAGDPDLMYSDEYLAAVWNPQPQPGGATQVPGRSDPTHGSSVPGSQPQVVLPQVPPSQASGVQTPRSQAAPRRAGISWMAVLACLAIVCLGGFVVWLVVVNSPVRPAAGGSGDQGSMTMAQKVKNAIAGRSAAKPPDDSAIYNPLSARCGSFVDVNEIDFRGKNYRIAEIRQYDHAVGGKHFTLTDYVLRFGEELVRVRTVPFEDRWKVLLLNLYDDRAYEEGLHNVVRDDTLKFVVDDPEANLHEEYWRVEDVRESYKARVTILCGDGKDAPPQVSQAELEYWDYWRDTEVDGVKVTQYLYVEMNTANGWFQLWRGMESDPERIVVT